MKRQVSFEHEYKWRVEAHKDFMRFLSVISDKCQKISRPEIVSIQDTYLDTPNQLFASHGIKLRIRKIRGQFELTLKGGSRIRRGFVRRVEKTITIPPSIHSTNSAVRWIMEHKLKSALKGHPLRTLFTIQNKRMIRSVHIHNRAKAELSFDQLCARAGRRMFRMSEIEMEFTSGSLAVFHAFARALQTASNLKIQQRSKVASAVKFFSLKTPKKILRATTLRGLRTLGF